MSIKKEMVIKLKLIIPFNTNYIQGLGDAVEIHLESFQFVHDPDADIYIYCRYNLYFIS